MYVLATCILLILYKIAVHLSTRIHNSRAAQNRGCLPPPRAPDLGFFGLATLRASIAATKAGQGPQWMHKMLNEIGKDVHTVSANILDYQLLVTRDPENVKAIFNTQASDFDIGPHRERTFKSVFGLGIMTARGERWKHSRAMIRPQFARTNVANIQMLEKHFQCLLRRLKVDDSGWTEMIDLQPLLQNFTLDTGTEFLYGQSVFSQDTDLRARLPLSWAKGEHVPDISNFGHHLDEMKAILDRQGAFAKYGGLFRSKRFHHHRSEIWKFVDYFVAQALINEENAGLSETVQGRFVLLNELARETKDPLELRCETLNVLHASRDTTAALIGWMVYFLARNQRVFQTLRAEILRHFPESGNDQSEITFQNLHSLRYMHHVVNETIRLVEIIPMNERAASCDTTLPRGGGDDGMSPIFVAKGQQLLLPTYSMQHREDIWGPDHDQFKPERWEDKRHGWDWIPFGSGVRQCLGQQFARTESMFVITRLIQHFDAMEPQQSYSEAPLFHHTIENRSGTGVWVRLHADSDQISKHDSQYEDADIDRGGVIV